jgi:glycosyltransferase involved in cell wall biosynthesis
VDNACEEDVRALAMSYAAKAQVSYIAEPRVGLSRARNTGLENSKGKLVAFLDDDAVAAPKWLEAIRQTFAESGPNLAVVGGPTTLLWEKPRPAWLADSLQAALGYVDYGRVTRPLVGEEWLYGLNMAFRASSLKGISGFPLKLGREGNRRHLISSEEIIVQARLAGQGCLRMYNPSALVSHAVVEERLTPGWLSRRYYWQGVSTVIMTRLLEHPVGLRRFRRLGRDLRALMKQPRIARTLVYAMVRKQRTADLEQRCKALWHLGLVRGWVRPFRLSRATWVNELSNCP